VDSVHEMVVANVVLLWFALGATALMILRRRGAGPSARRALREETAQHGTYRFESPSTATDWQPEI
jgi:hypothetical protein